MEYDAFISYRHGDGAAARGVVKLLRAFNQKVFIDEDIAAGDEWAPEIWDALAVSRVLLVLWSRSAAKSKFVRREWGRAPEGCRVFALQLDGEPLPEDLGRFNAIGGLDVGGRLLARSVELMRAGKLSPSQAQQKLVDELASDGVVLEPKQKEALAAFLPLVSNSLSWAPLLLTVAALLLLTGVGYVVHEVVEKWRTLTENLSRCEVAKAHLATGLSQCDAEKIQLAESVSRSDADKTAISADLTGCKDELEKQEDLAEDLSHCKDELKDQQEDLDKAQGGLQECKRTITRLENGESLRACNRTIAQLREDNNACSARLRQCRPVPPVIPNNGNFSPSTDGLFRGDP